MKTRDQLTIEALQASLADKERLLNRVYKDRDAQFKEPAGVGGVYRRQDRCDMVKSDLLDNGNEFYVNGNGDFQITWSRNARLKFKLSTCSVIKGNWFHSLPSSVHADNWWHVCAQVGLTEPLARLFYYHPENEQESAVAKAKPVQRGPMIYCQENY